MNVEWQFRTIYIIPSLLDEFNVLNVRTRKLFIIYRNLHQLLFYYCIIFSTLFSQKNKIKKPTPRKRLKCASTKHQIHLYNYSSVFRRNLHNVQKSLMQKGQNDLLNSSPFFPSICTCTVLRTQRSISLSFHIITLVCSIET